MDRRSIKYIITRTGLALVLTMAAGVADMEAALNAGYYAGSSLLDSGKWVKVKIKESGVHRITDEQLREMGFSDPSKVAVYGYGASLLSDYQLSSDLPDDLPAVPMMRSGDGLLFYGEGDVSLSIRKRAGENFYATVPQRNYYADYSTYFLTDSRQPLAMDEVELKKNYSGDISESFGMVHVEDEVSVPGEVGARMFGEDFSRSRECTVTFEMPSYEYSLAGDRNVINLDLEFGISSNTSNYVTVTLPSGDNRSLYVSQTSTELFAYIDCTRRYPDHPQVSADGTYSVKIDASKLSMNAAGVDFVSVTYPRTNRLNGMTQETLVVRDADPDKRVILENVADGTMVWDITDRYRAKALAIGELGNGNGERSAYVSVAARGDAYLLAFDPEGTLPSVEVVGEVPSQNLHGLRAPRMLIIASRPFMEEAERLAQAHRSVEGKDVLVVCQDEIYNEFSSGTPHIMGLRRFARMLHDKDPEKFRSILLFGPASYENRGLTALDPANFHNTYIPMYQREDIAGSGKTAESYATDAVVGMLEETDGTFDIGRSMMTVAVGRIPASDINDARACVNKSIEYLENPPTGDFRNRALLMCDKGDANGHMADANGVAELIEAYSPETTIYKAYNTIYPWSNGRATELNRAASQVLKRGVAYWAYSGHATTRFFGAEQIWSVTQSNEETYEIQPFVMLATCRALFYDHPEENIGEAMLYNEKGGAIALVGALRQVYKEHNQKLNLELARQYYTAPQGMTFGEIFLQARNRMVPQTGSPVTDGRFYDTIYNTLSYNYIGDPELAPGMPTCKVTVDEINGQPLGTEELEVESGRAVTFAGGVYDSDGGLMTGFNGEVSLSIFDGVKTVNVINVDASSSTSETVTLNEDLLVEAKAEVKNGRFSARVYLPEPLRHEGVNRLSLYAQDSTDPLLQGSGVHTNINVTDNGNGEVVGEETVPMISAMYIDTPEFRDGDVVTGRPTLYVEVAPNDYGIMGYSSHPGKSMKLFIDGNSVYANAAGAFRGDTSGGGSLEYPLVDMADGPHELTLRIANNAGQTTTRTIRFTMVNVHATSTLLVDEEQSGDEMLIEVADWEYDSPVGRVTVIDGTGKAVFSDSSASFPYSWNMRGNDGAKVPEGPYRVEAYLSGGGHYGSARSREFVIIKE